MQDFVNTTDIIPATKTDHAAIELNLTDSNQNSRGPGFWKMNVSLLEDPNYLEELKQNIPLWKTTGSDNLSDKRCIWDWLKYNIRNHAILFSKKKAKERSAMEKNLQQVYEEATKKFEQDPSDSNLNTLNEAKEILESYYEEKTRGVIIRARARWHEHGERSTKYFLNLEKRNHVKKHIRKLLISGSITSDPFGILNEQKRFYHSLYKSNVTDEDRENGNEFLNNLNIPRLSEENNLVSEKYLLKKLQPSLTVFRVTNLLVMMEYQ